MGLSAIETEQLSAILHRHGASATRLLQILREVQDYFLHIPGPAVDSIAASLNVPRTRVLGVAEFYSFFSTRPNGRYHLLISDSISDHLLGSRDLMVYLCRRLGVEPGQTRPDGRVSVDFTSCTGLSDQGPAGLVNGYALPRLDKARIDRIVALVEQDVSVSQWPKDLFEVQDQIRRPGLLLQSPVKPGTALKSSVQRGFEGTLEEIEKSGLRGRGGAGFPTSSKWRFCRETTVDRARDRYVVCNADEGEPGTFKDRVLLSSYAHQVFEGMTLCAAIIGARQGFLYLRGEYRHLLEHLESILAERRRASLLGANILGQADLDFDIEIHLGAGAYICGEESALIESLEGKRGEPRNRPPYPVTSGYLGQPTVVNNVETFAAAAAIALHGSDWFARHGTVKSKGSKVLSICGDCSAPGIYEYDFGVPIRQILSDCGADEALGVQVGGPSGTFIGASEFDRLLAFEDLPTGGSFMIFNKTRDILEIVRNFTHFFAHESCGFCTPCRVGTSLLKNELDKICCGHGTAGDLVELTRLGRVIRSASHCGLGQTAANPVLSTLERFPELYESRLKAISFEPGFDLDAALAVSRQLTGRDDALAHLEQEGP